MRTIDTDILIFGGGIAGLWLLNRLRAAGYSALLLEQDKLGGHETLNANGIIHGGLKFGLTALLRDVEDLDDMPALWRDCLTGRGDINLAGVKVLAEHQYLWTEPSLAARATAFFATRLISGEVRAVEGAERPDALRNPGFEGNVYELADLVIDLPSLVQKLAQPQKSGIYKVSMQNCHLETDDRHNTTAVFITAAGTEPLRIKPRRVILAGGQGNQALLEDLGLREPAMERRPVHMVLLKRAGLPAFHAHCLGNSSKPRLTITSHPCRDGEVVWYLGGELADEGAQRDERLQIEQAQRELKALLPWIDLRGARYKSLRIDRILPADPGLFRPDNAYVTARGNNLVVWPCKLTLAPNLGRQVLALLEKEGFAPEHPPLAEALPLLYPETGLPAWETLFS